MTIVHIFMSTLIVYLFALGSMASVVQIAWSFGCHLPSLAHFIMDKRDRFKMELHIIFTLMHGNKSVTPNA
jgi:hypothetical protein